MDLQPNDDITIVIRRGHILQLAEDGKNFMFDPKVEAALVAVLEHQQLVNDTVNLIKMAIAQDGMALSAGFTGVRSDRIKVMNRAYGGKYGIDMTRIAELPKELVNQKTTYTPNTKAIDDYAKKHDSLPLGITVLNRPKQVSIKLAETKEIDND